MRRFIIHLSNYVMLWLVFCIWAKKYQWHLPNWWMVHVTNRMFSMYSIISHYVYVVVMVFIAVFFYQLFFNINSSILSVWRLVFNCTLCSSLFIEKIVGYHFFSSRYWCLKIINRVRIFIWEKVCINVMYFWKYLFTLFHLLYTKLDWSHLTSYYIIIFLNMLPSSPSDMFVHCVNHSRQFNVNTVK